VELDTRDLAAGVYMVGLDAAGVGLRQRLVVQR